MTHTCLFENSLIEVFSTSKLNYNCCLLTDGITTVTVVNISEQSLKIFTLMQMIFMVCPIHLGNVLCSALKAWKTLYLQMSCLETGVVPFEIKGVYQ